MRSVNSAKTNTKKENVVVVEEESVVYAQYAYLIHLFGRLKMTEKKSGVKICIDLNSDGNVDSCKLMGFLEELEKLIKEWKEVLPFNEGEEAYSYLETWDG